MQRVAFVSGGYTMEVLVDNYWNKYTTWNKKKETKYLSSPDVLEERLEESHFLKNVGENTSWNSQTNGGQKNEKKKKNNTLI